MASLLLNIWLIRPFRATSSLRLQTSSANLSIPGCYTL